MSFKTGQQYTRMAKTPKNEDSRGLSLVNLGKARKARISRYRAKKEVEGTPIRFIDDAINTLLDKALDLEKV